MDNDSEPELSFKSFISNETVTAPEAPVAALAAPQIQPETQPVQDAVGSVATDGAAADVTPVVTQPLAPETPVERQARFEDSLRKRGWAVDGLDPESLYETAADQLQASIELQSQLSARDKELAELRARLNQPSPVAPVQSPVAPVATVEVKPSRFGLLKEPHGATREYVQKSASGSWVVKPDYAGSTVAFSAAEEWNSYERQSAERANMLIQNPRAPWEEEIKPEFEQMIEQRARSIFEEYTKKNAEEAQTRAQQEAQARAQQEELDAVTRFDQEHAKEFYQLGPNGQPVRLLGTNTPITTPFYQQFIAKYEEYANEYPQLPQVKLAKLAYDFTKTHASALAPAAPIQPQSPAMTPEQIQQQTADKKARFVDQRSAPVKAPGNMQAASIEQMSAPPGNRFKDYIEQDQENAGNPVWEQMRSR